MGYWVNKIMLDGVERNLFVPPAGTQPTDDLNSNSIVEGDNLFDPNWDAGTTHVYQQGNSYVSIAWSNPSSRQGVLWFYIGDTSDSVLRTQGQIWWLDTNPCGFALYVDDDNQTASVVVAGTHPSYGRYIQNGASPDAKTYNWYIGTLLHYNWKSFDVIRGNSGQYRCYLTTIGDPYIPDSIDITTWFSLGMFSRLSDESSIWNAYLNAPTTVERDIAWSGNCRMSLTIYNNSYPEQKVFTFKFYTPDVTTPFYSVDYALPVASTLQTSNFRNFYLSFLYDEEQQCAVFYPIGLVPLSDPYYCHPSNTAMTENEMASLFLWLMASSAGEGDPDNPYDTGSEDNGGEPSGYEGPQDDLLTITPPTLDASTSGLYRIYCPTDTQLVNIASFLWSNDFISNVKKYFYNVADNIMAFYVLPYKPSNLPTKTFRVGAVDSEVANVEYVYDRFVTIDMGEVNVGSKWGSYLDFEPYTKFNIYLPGIGVQALDGDEIMCPTKKNRTLPAELGSTLKLEYNMDLMTGILVAFIRINGQVRYQFTGKIGYQIPLSGETHRSLLQGYAMATAGLVGMIASGGSAAPFTASAATAGIVNAMKPDFYRGGNLSGDAASMCYKTPYLITRRPNKPKLVDQQKFTGFQSYKTGLLSEFSGYTECVDAHVEGISCTEEERDMIIDWLRKGVIL